MFQKLILWLNRNQILTSIESIGALPTPFFIVAMPGCLCELILCVKHFNNKRPLVIIDNGLSDWEANWLRNWNHNLKTIQFASETLNHDLIIDTLINNFDSQFGILDYDCFIFDTDLLEKLDHLASDEMISALFCQTDNDLGLFSPETFIAVLNPTVIRPLQKEFSASSRAIYYDQLTPEQKSALLKIGIDRDHPIEKYKGYFDTTRLWVCLGYAKGLRVKFIKRLNTRDADGVFHVGAGTSHTNLNRYWTKRGTWFWRRALEECPYQDLREYYYQKYGPLTTQDVLKQVPEIKSQLGDVYFENVEKIVR